MHVSLLICFGPMKVIAGVFPKIASAGRVDIFEIILHDRPHVSVRPANLRLNFHAGPVSFYPSGPANIR
jgi:hypothetical protein